MQHDTSILCAECLNVQQYDVAAHRSMNMEIPEARVVTPMKKNSLYGILPLLFAFLHSITHPGQPSTTGAGAGGSSGASKLPIMYNVFVNRLNQSQPNSYVCLSIYTDAASEHNRTLQQMQETTFLLNKG